MIAIFRGGAGLRAVVAAGLGVCATAGAAAAQSCPTCGTAGGGAGMAGQSTGNPTKCAHYGLRQYPVSELRYIKQFCNPTIAAGSCFGHFKTQWTAWPVACPGWGDGSAGCADPGAAAGAGPVVSAPAYPSGVLPPSPNPPAAATSPAPSAPLAAPKAVAPSSDGDPAKVPTVPKVPAPDKVPPTSPKSSGGPAAPPTTNAADDLGLVLPPVPNPVGLPRAGEPLRPVTAPIKY